MLVWTWADTGCWKMTKPSVLKLAGLASLENSKTLVLGAADMVGLWT